MEKCADPKCDKIHMTTGHHYGECKCIGCVAEVLKLKEGPRQ